MAAGTAVSRVLGVARGTVLIGAIGVSTVGASTFGVANVLPNMLYMLLAGGVLNAVLVPQVVRAFRDGAGQEYVDRLLSLSIALMAAVTVVLTAAAPLVVRIAASSERPDYMPLATAFAFWCIPQLFFYGLYTLLGQVLNARGSFGPYMWAPVVNNVVSILGFGIFIAVYGDTDLSAAASWTAGPIGLLGATATLGIAAQALVLVWPIRALGLRFRWRTDWRGTGLGSAGRVAGWTFGALVVGQLGVIVVTRVTTAAGQVMEGAANNAAYNSAFTIYMLPHSLVTVSLLTALFTRFSAHAAADDVPAMRRDVTSALRSISVFTIVAAVLLSVLALPVVRVVLFTTKASEAASMTPLIVALAVSLPALGVWSLVQRVHYAYEDARSLFRVQVVMAAIVAGTALLGRLLAPVESWTAVACVGISASYAYGALWGVRALRRRLGPASGLLRLLTQASVAGLVAAAIGWPMVRLMGNPGRGGLLRSGLVCLVVGLVVLGVYAGLLHLMHVPELGQLATPVVRVAHRTMEALTARVRPRGVPVEVEVGQGTLVAGRYRLVQPSPYDLPGAEAWTGQDTILDRPVRVLVLRGEHVRQAQDAARRAALVNDPRLLRVLDVGDHEGVAYVVTERIPGRDLGQLVAQAPLPADQARAIIGEAAVALEVARRRGVHHLALRPSAVHVTPAGGVVVSGLAFDGELVEHGPTDARATSRADAVALVGLLYVALTGRWPGASGALAAGVPTAPQLNGRPVPPAELVAGVPNDLDTLCAVTLGPHEDGPASPSELVRELEPWGAVTVTEPMPRSPGAAAAVAVGPEVADETAVEPEAVLVAGPGAEAASVTASPAAAGSGAEANLVEDGEQGTDAEAEPDAEPAPADADTATTGEELQGLETAASSGPTPAPLPAPDRVVARHPALGHIPASLHPPGTPLAADPPAVIPPSYPPTVRRPDPRVAAASAGTGGAARGAVSLPVDGGPARTPVLGVTPLPDPVDVPPRPAAIPAPEPGDPLGGSQAPFGRSFPERTGFEEIIQAPADLLVRKRFNPTPLVIVLVLGAVAYGLYLAWQAFWVPAGPLLGPPGTHLPSTSVSAPADPSASTPADPGTAQPPAGGAKPAIASAQQVDPPPGGDNNEHPELVDKAIDGDPATAWLSRTYKSPTYGMKPGIGYAIVLREPALVTKVTLTTGVTGGMVEVRATTPDKPTEGAVLASGPLSASTVLTLSEPTQASSIVLWFPTLPQTADALNRVVLNEVAVS